MLLDIKFMFCSVHDFWVLRTSVHCPCFTNPRFTNLRYTTSFFVNRSLFTSLRFAQSSFELPRFTSPHFGIVHVLDTKFMFCNVHDFWVLHKSVLHSLCFTNHHILRILLQSETSTLDVLRVPLHSPLFKDHVLRFDASDMQLQICFTTLFFEHVCFTKSIFVLQVQRFYEASALRLLPRQCLSQSMFLPSTIYLSTFITFCTCSSDFTQLTFCTVDSLQAGMDFLGGGGGGGCTHPLARCRVSTLKDFFLLRKFLQLQEKKENTK